jgi:hypothetical protein
LKHTQCNVPNCAKCKQNNICDHCEDFYFNRVLFGFLKNTICLKCPINSLSCDYQLYRNEHKIENCIQNIDKINFQLNKCFVFDTNCKTFFKNTVICKTCKEKYFLKDTEFGIKCSPCPFNCKDCIDFFGCVTCPNNFYLLKSAVESESICVPCPSNCVRCINNELCLECKLPYTKEKFSNIILLFLTNRMCKKM